MKEVKQIKHGGRFLYAMLPAALVKRLTGLYLVRVKGFKCGPTYWWSRNYPIRELPNLDKVPCVTQ